MEDSQDGNVLTSFGATYRHLFPLWRDSYLYLYIYGCLCFIYTGLCCFMFTTSIYVRLFEIVTVAAVCWIDARSLLWLWTLSNFKIVVTQNE